MPSLSPATKATFSPRGLLMLIVAAAAGEALHRGLGVPVSGPVLGMSLMLALFALKRGVPPAVEDASKPLLKHLSVFFIPAAVGVMGQFALIGRHWPAMALALLGSSVLCLLATAGSLHAFDRLLDAWPRGNRSRPTEETP